MKWTGMLVVSLRGVNFGFWSRLGCSGQNVIIFSRQGLVQGCTRRNNKKERILIRYSYSFRGLHNVRPHPDWSLLGVKFKNSDEHPRPFHMGVPPPPPPPLMAWIFSQLANYAKLHKLLIDFITGRHYNAGNSDVLLARAPPLGGKEERTDDISDYLEKQISFILKIIPNTI